MELIIRKALDNDFSEIWNIFHAIVQKGDTYVFPPHISCEEAKNIWMGQGVFTYVATLDGEVVGTYILKPNHMGLGSHVANGSYMVHQSHQGKKIGYKLGEHSLEEAKRLGFKAMQYNIVVSTNESAIRLWKKLGFEIVGQLPKVFNHQQLGYVDAFVMHRFLT
jgi:L-amino acid N-acyltransferase YncA